LGLLDYYIYAKGIIKSSNTIGDFIFFIKAPTKR
jgi:hypothetical protein